MRNYGCVWFGGFLARVKLLHVELIKWIVSSVKSFAMRICCVTLRKSSAMTRCTVYITFVTKMTHDMLGLPPLPISFEYGGRELVSY